MNRINLNDLAAINSVMHDLFGGKVTSENFHDWYMLNCKRFLSGMIATDLMLRREASIEVEVIGAQEAVELVTNA